MNTDTFNGIVRLRELSLYLGYHRRQQHYRGAHPDVVRIGYLCLSTFGAPTITRWPVHNDRERLRKNPIFLDSAPSCFVLPLSDLTAVREIFTRPHLPIPSLSSPPPSTGTQEFLTSSAMMRSHACLALFLAAASRVAGHPLCYDDTPTNLEMDLTFCPEQQDGACCTAMDEAELETRFLEAGDLSTECSDYYTQVG